jgi:N-acetylmuramoyl-L-alanine amidase
VGSLSRFIAIASALALLTPAFARADAAGAELIVDNGDAAVQKKGGWASTTTTGGFYGADYLFRVAGDGSSSVTWPFPADAPAGRYQVFARWSSGPNRASNATYQVTSNGGATGVSQNQKANGGSWQPLGTFDFQPGRNQGVTLTDKADGVVVADAIRWLSTQAAAAPAPAAPGPQPSQQVEAAVAQPAPGGDPRTFDQTRYRIDQDQFWEYFQKRGGVRTLGYPVSHTFVLGGMKVQIFQRQVLQLRPDGGVQLLNLLDDGLLPYTRFNGSVVPAPEPALAQAAPKPDQPNYGERAIQFVRDNAPDTFDGEPVNFGRTFFNSLSAQDAFPGGVPDGGEALLPGFDLELWGLPTSKPARDPSNANFVYQRFQRGIMHYDKGCGCTQGLLLADYLKAVLTNRNLPGDLAAEAKGSKLLNQWAPTQPLGLARPGDLPGSNLQGAFDRNAIVTVDPGHGGGEIGASHTFADGTVLQEKNLNLRVALRVRDLLNQAGLQAQATRTSDAPVNADKKDLTGDGQVGLADDLQARVDVANATHSDVLVSVHFNGTSDPNQHGTYIFWDPGTPYADKSKALAEMVDAAVVASLKGTGYATLDHGATQDTAVLGGDHYYLLSPKTNVVPRPSQMPAIICEGLFLTNDADAAALRNDAVLEAIAQGYVQGIKNYLAKYPVS